MSAVRAHYDRQAAGGLGDVQQALQQRSQSVMYKLKKFHNVEGLGERTAADLTALYVGGQAAADQPVQQRRGQPR